MTAACFNGEPEREPSARLTAHEKSRVIAEAYRITGAVSLPNPTPVSIFAPRKTANAPAQTGISNRLFVPPESESA